MENLRTVLTAYTCIMLLVFSAPSFAQDDAPTPPAPESNAEAAAFIERSDEELAAIKAKLDKHPYSPEHCEFTINFPTAPYTTQQCDGDDKSKCYEQTSYTEVFDDLIATVKLRVICNKVDEALYTQYSGKVMEGTVKAMTRGKVIEEFNSAFREEDGYKQTGLVGAGRSGKVPTIYIAQLWIGKQSALSVEAELIGDAYMPADKLFSDILKTVRFTGVKGEEEKNEDGN